MRKSFYAVLLVPLMAGTLWINTKTVKSTNPFFSNGIVITVDGKKYELGFHEDGTVVWRYAK
jgi:hypothetical protein